MISSFCSLGSWISAAFALLIIAGYVIALAVFIVTWYGQTSYAATRRWKAINRAERRRKTCVNCGEPGVAWQAVTWGFIGKEPPGWWVCAEHAA